MVQAIMLSGRYRCGALTCHWIKNYDGGCKLSSTCKDIIEDLPHILTQCSALITTRNNLFQFAKKYVEVLPDCIRFLILNLCRSENPLHHQFLLDCSSIPSVIQAHQIGGTDVLHHLFWDFPREGFLTPPPPPPPPQKVCKTQIPYYCNFVYIVTSLNRLG